MRWSLNLPSPGLAADTGPFDAERLERGDCSLMLGPDREGRTARVGVSWDGRSVEVAALAIGRADFGARPDHEEWYNRAHLTVLLAEKIGALLGVPLRGLSMGLRGHLSTLVETPDGAVVIDGMLGLWFHALDNRRLATLDEMRRCREIAERVWYAPRAHGHEFFYGRPDQLIRAFKSGPLRWPSAG